jgi:hypothetical protein
MKTSRRGSHLLLTGATIAMAAAQLAHGAETKADSATPPLLTPFVDLRLRSENVSQSGIRNDAEAITLRGRLGFETATWRDTSLLAEAEVV